MHPSHSANRSLFALVLAGVILLAADVLHAGPVNINSADAATISRELKGIGVKRAQAIVEYRQKHGPFKSADELGLVKGIGPVAIQNNRTFIRVDSKAVAGNPPTPPQNGAPSPRVNR
jgi:competence protein ComEA